MKKVGIITGLVLIIMTAVISSAFASAPENEAAGYHLTGYSNIVLFGIDSKDHSFDTSTRSDTIMIVSINNDTGAIKMVSLYRDTYMKITGDEEPYYDRVNSAYNNGGAKCAISTLNTNLDLNITDYVTVNFNGLREIVDLMGGIDVNITEPEMNIINKISTDMIEGTEEEYAPLTEYGEVHLSGLQTTAYCRIRDAVYYDETGTEYHYDFGRTARQRSVLQKLVTKAKSGGVIQIVKLAWNVLNMNTEDSPFIKTSLSYIEIINLIPVLIDYNIEGSSGFPYTLATPTISGEDLVVAKDLEDNVTKLHEFLFDEVSYQPSDTVKEISEYIMEYTGVSEDDSR